MTLWQKKVKTTTPHKLTDGKLHYSNLFDFNTTRWVRPLEGIITILKEQEPKVSMRCTMINAYNHLLQMVRDQLRDPASLPNFMSEPCINDNMDKEQVERAKVQVENNAEHQRDKVTRKIDILQGDIKNAKAHMVWGGEKDSQHKSNLEYQEEYEGQTVPHPNEAMKKFLHSDYAIQMEKQILLFGKSKELLTRWQLKEINRYLILRLLGRNGHRKDSLTNFRMEDWYLRKPNAVCPFDEHDKANIGIYNMNLDTSVINYDKIKGEIVHIRFHKTCHKFELYLFFTLTDMTLLKHYEVARATYMASIGKSATDIETPFFINSYGGPALSKNQIVYMEHFNREVDIPRSRSHLFRKMFVDFAFNHNEGELREQEKFAMCHSTDTAEESYLGPASKMRMALNVTTKWRQNFDGDSETTEKVLHVMDPEHIERERKGKQEARKRCQDLRLQQRALQDKAKPITKNKPH